MRLPRIAILSAVATALLWPAAAQADFQTLYDDYNADGVIDGCAYPSSELSAGLNNIPADVREYDPGFTDALNTALEQVAAGCGTAPQVAVTKNEVTAVDGSPGPAVPKSLAVASATGGRSLPGVMDALIAILGAALALAALLGAAHYYGWDLRGRLAPVSGAARAAERRLSDGLRSVLERLGF
jgi:hypothetical protein